jgi:hypothetical protein
MNERIGKLAVEAGAYWDHGDWNMPSSVYFSERDLEKFAELIVAEYLLPRKPLTEERIWEIKLKSHQKYMSRKWVEETDTRSGHYEDVERHTDSPVTFARAIEAAHGIGVE